MLVLLAGLMVLGYAATAHAAPGDLDSSFGTFGKVTTDFADGFDVGNAVAVQDDGKVVVAGYARDVTPGIFNIALARYNPDGTLDSTFGGGDGKVTTGFTDDAGGFAQDVAIRADGKIVVTGSAFITSSGNTDFGVVRFDPDGTLDAGFGGGDGKVTIALGSEEDVPNSVAVRGNKTVVVGYSRQPGTGLEFAVARLTNNGDPDPTFGGGDGKVTTDIFPDGFSDIGRSVAIQPDGKILAVGAACACTGGQQDDFALVRYNANGTLDTSFDTDGKTTTNIEGYEQANSVALQEDGRIVAAGTTSPDTVSPSDFALVRYNTNGSLNTSFGTGGKTTTTLGGVDDRAQGVVVQDDGRILAAGFSRDDSGGSDFVLARYNADGSINNTFDNDGRVTTDFSGYFDAAFGVALQTDGKAVVAGYASKDASTTDTTFAAARYFIGDDSTPPRVSAPVQTLNVPSTLGATSVPVKISWSATDVQGDVTNSQLQLSTDGKPYANVALTSPIATNVTRSLRPNHNYRFRVRATDDNGNTSFFRYGSRFTVDAVQEDDASVTYSPVAAWTRQPLSGAYGGQVAFSRTNGASATLAFTGTNVAWVAPKRSVSGTADVFLDNKKVATVDLRSPVANPRRVLYAANGLSPTANHTLKVIAAGTARVDVDAFVVLR